MTLPRSWRPLDELRAAAALLTRLPVGGQAATSGGAAAFGLVGALVGAIGGAVILLAGSAAPLAAAVLAVALTALVTGGLHVDGLADTADALAAGGPEAAERARTDPHVGAAGALAIVVIVALDAGWLVALTDRSGVVVAALAWIVAASTSRALIVLLAAVGPSGGRGRSGAWFVQLAGRWSALAAVGGAALVVVLSAIASGHLELLVGSLVGAALATAVALWLIRMRGGIDGDVLGASVEISTAWVLGVIVLLAT